MGLLARTSHCFGAALTAAINKQNPVTAFRTAWNRYESATQQWGDRSWLPATVQDARLDADGSTRIELVRRSRYWERNNAIVNRLADLFEQFTVGPNGLQVIPNSDSETWNQAAQEWWQGWCQYPDLVSLQPFGILQGLIARSWFVDGEIFIQKTISPDTGRPRVRLIEAHRIQTPQGERLNEGKTIVDGIKINPFGRPTAYMVLQGETDGKQDFIPVPASEMIHVFEPGRPGQYRGIPFLYPVMNDLHDMDDLQLQEMKKAKQVANLGLIITNASGEADPATLRRQRLLLQSQDQAGNTVTKQPDSYYDATFGAAMRYLKKDEDVKILMSENPSAATQWYWDYLTAKVCAGVGISKLLVMPYSMQGTVTRADLDVSTAFFRSRSAVIAVAVRQIYEWAIQWAIQFDRTPDGVGTGTPGDWKKAAIRPPRAPNVDVGRNSSAMLAELESGTRTYQDIYAENGEDWKQQLEQKAQEAAFIQKMAIKYVIDPGLIAVSPTPPKPEPTAATEPVAA